MINYSFRFSAFDIETTYQLEDNNLYIKNTKKDIRIPFRSITKVQLSYNASMRGVPETYFCYLTDTAGKIIKLKSLHFLGMGNFEDRREPYGSFVKKLHKQLSAQTILQAGSGQILYYFSYFLLIVIALMGIGTTFFLALQTKLILASCFLLSSFFLGKKLLVYIRNSKPMTYTLDKIPQSLLP